MVEMAYGRLDLNGQLDLVDGKMKENKGITTSGMQDKFIFTCIRQDLNGGLDLLEDKIDGEYGDVTM